MRWRVDMAARRGKFDRANLLLSVMLVHAKTVALRLQGSNPARGPPSYKLKLRVRYLRAHEHCALLPVRDGAEAAFPQGHKLDQRMAR